MKSLADFKRFLAQPGATIQLVRHDRFSKDARPEIWTSRTVAKLQTNAVKFSNGGWLHWDGKCGGLTAKSFRFEPDGLVTVNMSHDGSFSEVFQYKCTVQT